MDLLEVTLKVNGTDHRVSIEARRTLLDAIREDCGLRGTHGGCEHGVCGACTVLLDGEPVRACLMFAAQAEGHDVTTVEGLASPEGGLHPLQRAFMERHAIQCGFCTPGFLMLAAGILRAVPDIGEEDLIAALSSNICRCTGYHSIVEAVRSAARELHGP